jgi:hypothetical protein
MAIKITITNTGTDIGSNLDINYTTDYISWIYLTTQSLATLEAGYVFNAPMGALAYQVVDIGVCGVTLELDCVAPPSTTTTTTTEFTSFAYEGIAISNTYINALNACADDDQSFTYYAQFNTITNGDVLYTDPLLTAPSAIDGGSYYFSMSLDGTGPKFAIRIDNLGYASLHTMCSTTTTSSTTVAPTTTTTTTDIPTTTTTTTSP